MGPAGSALTSTTVPGTDALVRHLTAANPKTSAATLSAVPGNQRILAILAALNGSGTPRIQRAIAATADQALAESSASARNLGREFNPAADSVSTLLYGGFSPAKTLQATYDLAATNHDFGRARDALWQAASHESVFDSSTTLAANTHATVASDGSITAPVADVEQSVRDGFQDINARSTQAISDHRAVDRECPGPNCAAYKDFAQTHGAEARAAIGAQETTVAAAGGLLALLDAREGQAVQAEGQAAAQVASAFNSYFAAKDYGQYIHGAADIAGLVATLSVASVDPAAAINGVLNVVHDVINVAAPRPDATALILQGLQGVSQQLSAFAEETATQFRAVDTRLETISNQISTLASQLSTQLAEARTQLTGFGNALAAGTPLNRTLRKISDNDDGANGTGSKLFNAALGYYDSWVGTNGDRPSGEPALLQALRAERVHYVNTQRPQGIDSKGAAFIDPWGGPQQPLGDVDVLGSQWLQNPTSYFPVAGETIPDLKAVPELITRLPAAVPNAIRLDIGRIGVTWRATWQTPPAPGDVGALDVRLDFNYYVPASATRPAINDNLGYVRVFRPFTANCTDTGNASASAVATFNGGLDRQEGLPRLHGRVPRGGGGTEPGRGLRA